MQKFFIYFEAFLEVLSPAYFIAQLIVMIFIPAVYNLNDS